MNSMETLFTRYGLNYNLYVNGTYHGIIILIGKNLTDLSLFVDMNIQRISGSLCCSHNKLTSLYGCPVISGYLDCTANRLSSLDGCTHVGGDLMATDNELQSLSPCPYIGGRLYCRGNNITDIPLDFPIDLDRITCSPSLKQGHNYQVLKSFNSF